MCDKDAILRAYIQEIQNWYSRRALTCEEAVERLFDIASQLDEWDLAFLEAKFQRAEPTKVVSLSKGLKSDRRLLLEQSSKLQGIRRIPRKRTLFRRAHVV